MDSVPLASVDAEARDIVVQIGPLLARPERLRPFLGESGPTSLWRSRGLPSALARSGWRVSVREDSREILSVGRGTSPLAGHVHVSPAALWKLRKLL